MTRVEIIYKFQDAGGTRVYEAALDLPRDSVADELAEELRADMSQHTADLFKSARAFVMREATGLAVPR